MDVYDEEDSDAGFPRWWTEQSPYSFEYLEDQNAVYLLYQEVQSIEGDPIDEFADRLFAFIEENNVERLIIDVRNNGGGYFNHALFWQMMGPNGGGMPGGKLMAAIDSSFGSFDSFKEAFSKAAKTLFGSGWAWVVADAQGKLEIMQTHNQDTPLVHHRIPVLGIDVWEHAYYLQYENKRAEYVENFWNIINWKQCEKNYAG